MIMKKLAIAMMLSVSALAASAQVNYKVQTACHPQDVKHYDTERLRSSFMMEKVMAPDEINVTYTLYDRLIYGGAMPVNKILKLETFRELGPEITYFLERRELGVINVGGDGVVTVDGKEYPMKYKEALYVGCGNKEVTFKSNDAAKPAKFYINSAPQAGIRVAAGAANTVIYNIYNSIIENNYLKDDPTKVLDMSVQGNDSYLIDGKNFNLKNSFLGRLLADHGYTSPLENENYINYNGGSIAG